MSSGRLTCGSDWEGAGKECLEWNWIELSVVEMKEMV